MNEYGLNKYLLEVTSSETSENGFWVSSSDAEREIAQLHGSLRCSMENIKQALEFLANGDEGAAVEWLNAAVDCSESTLKTFGNAPHYRDCWQQRKVDALSGCETGEKP